MKLVLRQNPDKPQKLWSHVNTCVLPTSTSLSVAKGPILNKDYIILKENSLALLLSMHMTYRDFHHPVLQMLVPSRGRGENRPGITHHPLLISCWEASESQGPL